MVSYVSRKFCYQLYYLDQGLHNIFSMQYIDTKIESRSSHNGFIHVGSIIIPYIFYFRGRKFVKNIHEYWLLVFVVNTCPTIRKVSM